MKMDKTDKAIYGLIIFLVVVGGLIFLADKGKFLSINKPSAYYYSNGVQKFKILKFSEQNYAGYQIELKNSANELIYINIRNDPKNLETIEIDRGIFHKINNAQSIYITIEPYTNLTGKTTVAALEIDKFIDNKYFFNIPVNSSFTKKYQDFPVKNCGNSNNLVPVIWLKLGAETKVYSEGSCIIVEGKTENDIIRAADRLVLYLIGIMP